MGKPSLKGQKGGIRDQPLSHAQAHIVPVGGYGFPQKGMGGVQNGFGVFVLPAVQGPCQGIKALVRGRDGAKEGGWIGHGGLRMWARLGLALSGCRARQQRSPQEDRASLSQVQGPSPENVAELPGIFWQGLQGMFWGPGRS